MRQKPIFCAVLSRFEAFHVAVAYSLLNFPDGNINNDAIHNRSSSQNDMKVAAFLPAKGTSSRVPNKTTMLLDGDPMFLRSLRKLIACAGVDEVWLDTESHEIAELASDLKCKWLRRDPVLANNKTDGNQLFFNEIQNTDADICVMLLCTSPFIRQETIEKGG